MEIIFSTLKRIKEAMRKNLPNHDYTAEQADISIARGSPEVVNHNHRTKKDGAIKAAEKINTSKLTNSDHDLNYSKV